MKVCGIIAEYNPFHNGHIYHINKSKEISGADGVIVIMSGNFVQRGGPAIIDKWKRARSAVQNGADLVIELPYVYASQTAEIFARGAVKILNNTNSVDFLSFGSESENLDQLKTIAEIVSEEPEAYSEYLKENLKKGLNFPSAREKALESHLGREIPELSEPNNILAIEYLKTLHEIKSSIIPINVTRYKSSHNSPELAEDISSATSIRKVLLENTDHCFKTSGTNDKNHDISHDNTADDPIEYLCKNLIDAVPESTITELNSFLNDNSQFNSFDKIFDYVIYRLLLDKDIIKKDSSDSVTDIFDLDNDLLNRIINSLNSSSGDLKSINKLIDKIKSKNYTLTRIRRALSNIAMQITENEMNIFKHHSPEYIRILASNKNGFEIISKIKNHSDLKIINKFSEIKNIENDTDRKILEYEVLSTDLYYLLLGIVKTNQDFKISPFILK